MRLSYWLFAIFIIAAFFLNLSLVAAEEDDVDDDLHVTEEEDLAKESSSAGAKDEDDIEDEVEEEEEEDLIKSHSQVKLVVHFLDAKDQKKLEFPVATKVTALIGFHNKADIGFNVSRVGAFFHSPFDLDYFIQNFTSREIGFYVEPKAQATFEYSFTPDKSLEPLEFWLSGLLIYNGTDGVEYRSAWTNGTVELVEKGSELDAKKVFSYFLLLSVIGLFLYVGYTMSQAGGGGKRKTRKTAAERGAQVPVETRDEDWGGAYTPRAASRKQSRKKN